MSEKTDSICKMEFITDHLGQEILLKDGKFQVMMEWEKPYMHACIDAIMPKGDVLEIGFGCGYASTHIQKHKPKSHTIIEYHPVVAERAREWAKGYSNITIIEDTWQNAMPSLGSYDAVFFDDYPLESEQTANVAIERKKYANDVLASGQKTLDHVDQKLSFLKTIVYREQDIDSFFALLKKQDTKDPNVYFRFFLDLKKNQNIDEGTFSYALNRLKKEGIATEEAVAEHLKNIELPKASIAPPSQTDRLFSFLKPCLAKHMRKGAIFSCYLEDPTSKFIDEKFLELITDPFIEYKETLIPVQVPPHCNYYIGTQALVITVKKL